MSNSKLNLPELTEDEEIMYDKKFNFMLEQDYDNHMNYDYFGDNYLRITFSALQYFNEIEYSSDIKEICIRELKEGNETNEIVMNNNPQVHKLVINIYKKKNYRYYDEKYK